MRLLTPLLLLALTACDPKPDPELPIEQQPAEIAQRTRFEGRMVFTIKCDPAWHSSRDCHGMDMFRSSFEVTELTIKAGVLMEGDQPFRIRWACPKCVAN
jgi:hypothetical protein